MQTNIKPIQTAYNGYKFRSRLEARWAVFFDAMYIRYEYEIEGYDLGPAGWYLPDFWLPDFSLWVEVKPSRQINVKENKEHQQAETLQNMTGYPVMLCYGMPKQLYHYLYIADVTDSSCGTSEFYATFIMDEYTGEPLILVIDNRSCRTFTTADDFEQLDKFINISRLADIQGVSLKEVDLSEVHGRLAGTTLNCYVTGDSLSWQAALKARQARFEHTAKGSW